MPRTATVHKIVEDPKPARKPKATENAHDRFIRVAEPRVKRVLRGIALIGNLSSPYYDGKEDEITRMKESILAQVDESFARFTRTGKRVVEFQF